MALDDRFTPLGLATSFGFGLTFGAILALALGNIAYVALGLPLGIAFAFALSEDDRARTRKREERDSEAEE